MKKRLFKLLPILLLGLTACGGGGSDASSTSSGGGGSSEIPPTKDVTILCYIDYNHADEDNPYHQAKWYYSKTFTKEDIELTDPDESAANYPEFKTFKGWSQHPLIDNDDQLFKWGEVTKELDGTPPYVILYGIWVDA